MEWIIPLISRCLRKNVKHSIILDVEWMDSSEFGYEDGSQLPETVRLHYELETLLHWITAPLGKSKCK